MHAYNNLQHGSLWVYKTVRIKAQEHILHIKYVYKHINLMIVSEIKLHTFYYVQKKYKRN